MGIIDSAKSVIRTCGLRASKYSPQLCLIFGIAGVVGGTVLACHATLKVNDKIEERDRKLLELKERYSPEPIAIEAKEDEEVVLEAPISETKEYKHEVLKVHATTALSIAKDFIPAIVCTGGGIGLLINGHKVLNRRYLAMTAAYAGLQKSFNDYRENVRQRFGEEVDKELLYGAVDVTFTDVETGEEKTVKCVDVSKYGELSSQTRVLYSSVSPLWRNDAVYNLSTIELTIHNMNRRLEQKEDGVIFLNEVLDELGLPRTQAGNILGWKYDKNITNKIDAGIYAGAISRDQAIENFLDGHEPNIWLNFNVDGNVLELI